LWVITREFFENTDIISAVMPPFDHFDFIAPYYDRFGRQERPEKLIAAACLPVDGRILDLGGGTGRVAQNLVREGLQVVVADVSSGMVRRANQKPDLQPVRTAAEALPFPSFSFERIVMVDAFHHVADQPQVAAEMWRVLKPQGRIVIEEPDIRVWGVKLISLFEKLLLMRSHFMAPAAIAGLFNGHGAAARIDTEQGVAWVVIDKGIIR
jgi:ubiquinone/menaquinone biosynthesis C-methylase UbiE